MNQHTSKGAVETNKSPVESISLTKAADGEKKFPSTKERTRCSKCGSKLITDWGGNKCIHCNRDEILHSKSDNYVINTVTIKPVKTGDKIGKYIACVPKYTKCEPIKRRRNGKTINK